LPDVDLKDITSAWKTRRSPSPASATSKEGHHQGYHRIERNYGSFVRSFSVPNSFDTENIGAEFKNGVLSVTLPRRKPPSRGRSKSKSSLKHRILRAATVRSCENIARKRVMGKLKHAHSGGACFSFANPSRFGPGCPQGAGLYLFIGDTMFRLDKLTQKAQEALQQAQAVAEQNQAR